MRITFIRLVAFVVALAMLAHLPSPVALAQTYGEGTYGGGIYNDSRTDQNPDRGGDAEHSSSDTEQRDEHRSSSSNTRDQDSGHDHGKEPDSRQSVIPPGTDNQDYARIPEDHPSENDARTDRPDRGARLIRLMIAGALLAALALLIVLIVRRRRSA
ncbi:MAG: hypothetical protein QM753_05770 [Thermomicrobiales bacterium]